MRNTVSVVLAVWPWGAKAVNWLNMHPARQKVSCLYRYTGQRITSEMTQLFKYLLSEEKDSSIVPKKRWNTTALSGLGEEVLFFN